MGSRRHTSGDRGGSGHSVTVGITDLMTSLAVIFVLLLVVFASGPHSAEKSPDDNLATPSTPRVEAKPIMEVKAALEESSPAGVALEADPGDPQALRVVISESLLRFESGRSALTPSAERFLAEALPRYAETICGRLREHVAGVVIEGHTDDLGGDEMNLRLSQERSFRVLVRGLEAIRASAPDAHACFSALASASGRGKQDLVYDAAHRPDRDQSRRVVLKILLRPVAPRA